MWEIEYFFNLIFQLVLKIYQFCYINSCFFRAFSGFPYQFLSERPMNYWSFYVKIQLQFISYQWPMVALARIWTWKTAVYVVKLACFEKSLKKLVLKALVFSTLNLQDTTPMTFLLHFRCKRLLLSKKNLIFKNHECPTLRAMCNGT